MMLEVGLKLGTEGLQKRISDQRMPRRSGNGRRRSKKKKKKPFGKDESG